MEKLEQFVDQINELMSEKQSVQELIAEKYAEAKGSGFDIKVLRKVIADLRKDPDDLNEEASIYDVYMAAMGRQ